MKPGKSQEQAKKAFDQCADEWHQKASSKTTYSMIEHRNSVVLDQLRGWPQNTRFLDIGCGTGQLVVEAAKSGFDSVGVDYAEGMIRHCEQNTHAAGVKAQFVLGSFFDMTMENNSFEVVSALGFVEYLAQAELEEFLHRARDLLVDEGVLLVGTRNRLFNITTLNKFSEIEMELGNFENLVRQAMSFQKRSDSPGFEFLDSFAKVEPQPQAHPETGGIQVSSRFQYSPGELYYRLGQAGFVMKELFPVHYHAFPPAMKDIHLEEHLRIAAYAQEQGASDLGLVPWCSSLILSASRVADV